MLTAFSIYTAIWCPEERDNNPHICSCVLAPRTKVKERAPRTGPRFQSQCDALKLSRSERPSGRRDTLLLSILSPPVQVHLEPQNLTLSRNRVSLLWGEIILDLGWALYPVTGVLIRGRRDPREEEVTWRCRQSFHKQRNIQALEGSSFRAFQGNVVLATPWFGASRIQNDENKFLLL